MSRFPAPHTLAAFSIRPRIHFGRLPRLDCHITDCFHQHHYIVPHPSQRRLTSSDFLHSGTLVRTSQTQMVSQHLAAMKSFNTQSSALGPQSRHYSTPRLGIAPLVCVATPVFLPSFTPHSEPSGSQEGLTTELFSPAPVHRSHPFLFTHIKPGPAN